MKKTGYEGPDRRQWKRIKKQFVAKVRDGALKETWDRDSSGWDIVTTRDLGAGGIFFNYNRNIEKGLLLDMEINFPMSSTPINCAGEVIRVQKDLHSPIWGVATSFTKISEQEKRTINNAAEGFYSKKAGQIEP